MAARCESKRFHFIAQLLLHEVQQALTVLVAFGFVIFANLTQHASHPFVRPHATTDLRFVETKLTDWYLSTYDDFCRCLQRAASDGFGLGWLAQSVTIQGYHSMIATRNRYPIT